VACALVGDPDLVFLDEPTTGLDPQSRAELWDIIRQVRNQGATVLSTAHYMDEAERLCDRVAIVDHGQVIALDTPRALIASLGAEHVVTFTADGMAIEDATLEALDGVTAVRHENGSIQLTATELRRTMPALLTLLEQQRIRLTELSTHSATLEDVFVSLTGRH